MMLLRYLDELFDCTDFGEQVRLIFCVIVLIQDADLLRKNRVTCI